MSQWLNIDGFLYRMEEYSRCLSTLFETIISSPSPDTQWYIPIKCFRNLWLGLPLTNTPVYWVFFLLTWWETDYTHCFSFNFRQGQESLRWIWHNWQLIMKNIHIQSLYFFFHWFASVAHDQSGASIRLYPRWQTCLPPDVWRDLMNY